MAEDGLQGTAPASTGLRVPEPRSLGPSDLARLDTTARQARTPCGDGVVHWRGWGQGEEVVVLLHGGAGAWTHWVRNIDTFAARYTVWVPDLPGMGESALPPDPWTPESVADIVESGLQQLLGKRSCHVVGFSFGGMVGSHLAARHPARVRSLVLVAAAGNGLSTDPGARMRPWRRVEDAAERHAIHRHNLGIWMLHDPARVDDLAADVAAGAVEADRLRNREVSRTDTTLRVLPQVRCPVHGIWGHEDIMFAHTREPLEAALRAVGVASVQWIPQAGHWVAYEQPEAFHAAVLPLLGAAG